VIEGSNGIDLQYDASGNRVTQTATTGDSVSYDYDPGNRLEQVSGINGVLATYQYNGAGQRVIKHTPAGDEYSLYNLQGQRISQFRSDGTLLHNTLYWNGQPLAHYRPAAETSYRFVSIHENRDPAYFTVDLEEQRIQLTRYDGSVLDEVIEDDLWNKVETGEGTIYHFAIGEGNTMSLKGWVHFRHSGQQGFAHLIDKTEGSPVEYRFNGGRVLGDFYYHLDHLGTPQLMTDEDQTVIWQASYAPFGEATLLTEIIDNDLRLPGQYFDSESGLHYNYFRDYDPGTGRYVQSDPIGLQGGINTYAYVLNNPFRYIDPLGLHHHPDHKNNCAFGDAWCSFTGRRDITEEQKKEQECVVSCVLIGQGVSEVRDKVVEKSLEGTWGLGAKIIWTQVKKLAGPISWVYSVYSCNTKCDDSNCEQES